MNTKIDLFGSFYKKVFDTIICKKYIFITIDQKTYTHFVHKI